MEITLEHLEAAQDFRETDTMTTERRMENVSDDTYYSSGFADWMDSVGARIGDILLDEDGHAYLFHANEGRIDIPEKFQFLANKFF